MRKLSFLQYGNILLYYSLSLKSVQNMNSMLIDEEAYSGEMSVEEKSYLDVAASSKKFL